MPNRLFHPARIVGACCVIHALTPVACHAADWTQFRGPTGQGHVATSGLPLQWNGTENVVWKSSLPGQGWSSPVVKGNRIYLSASVPFDSGDGYSLCLLILDGDTGSLLKRAVAFEQSSATDDRIHSKNSHASPTPLIAGDYVYVHFGHQGMACFNLQGELIWRNDSFRYPPRHGNGGSPALVAGKIIFSCDGDSDPFILAIDQATGEVVWKTDRETDAAKTFSFSTPLVIQAAGRRQVISPGSNCVVSLDPDTGREIWRVNYDGYSVVPRPVFGHGLVYISTSFNTPVAMAIRPDGEGDVTDTHVQWQLRRGAPNTPSMLLVEDYLFMVSDRGIASCVDARTGQVAWSERLDGGYSASPIFADGRVYFLNELGAMTVVAADPAFRQLAQNELGERTLASPAVIDRDLLIRTEARLYRLGATR